MSDNDKSLFAKHAATVFSVFIAMIAYGALRASGLQGKMELSNKNVPTRSSFKTEPFLPPPSVTICPMVNNVPTVALLRLNTLRVADAQHRLDEGTTYRILKQYENVTIPNDGEKPINTSPVLDERARNRGITFSVLPFSVTGNNDKIKCAIIEVRGLAFNDTRTQLVIGVDVGEVTLSSDDDLYRAVTWGLYYNPEDSAMVYPKYGNLTDYATLFTAPHSHYTFASLKQSNTTVTRMVDGDEKESTSETTSPSPSSTPSAAPSPTPSPSAAPSGPPSPSPPVQVKERFQIASYDISTQSVPTNDGGTIRTAWLRLNFDEFLVHTVEEREDKAFDGFASELMLFLSSLSAADILPKILKIVEKLRKRRLAKGSKKPRPLGRELAPVPPPGF
eukprot:TRINITY_DN2338_c0_g1_i1.p1 TRINITY_DN2338_c0_g1~~TRINITY_DN2338_c0_g1_i1.p1  ORF type:complete len:391 (-),score=67.65 TRINITY_DN2338_c0_g1_i1:68-1240(-)